MQSTIHLFSSMRNPSTVQVRNHFVSVNVTPGANFSFVKGTSSQEDYCEMPYAHHTQGHFFSDWRSIPALYPVFSPAKARGFMDIRIPSHYYFSSMPRYTYGWDSISMCFFSSSLLTNDFYFDLGSRYVLKAPKELQWAAATITGPNNASGVVWALGMCFFCFSSCFLFTS